MTDELARIILLAGFAIVMPVGIYHRVRSSTDERLDRRQEGWLILLSLRPLALAAMVGLVAFLIEPSWMAWASFPLPNWARWSGVGLGVGSGGLVIWTFRSLGHNLTDTVLTRRDATLVTHGQCHLLSGQSGGLSLFFLRSDFWNLVVFGRRG